MCSTNGQPTSSSSMQTHPKKIKNNLGSAERIGTLTDKKLFS
jgi:hypothetical protein